MATIVEVLSNHPDYQGQSWNWNDSTIDPQSQTELDQEVTQGTPPTSFPLFIWIGPAPKPTYAELNALRAETDQIMLDNQSGDTARDRDHWLERASDPEGIDEGFRRLLYWAEQQNLFIRDLIIQVRQLGGTIDRVADPTAEQRFEKFLQKSREFDPNAGG